MLSLTISTQLASPVDPIAAHKGPRARHGCEWMGSYSTLAGRRTDVIRPIAALLVAGVALAAVTVGAEQTAASKALMNPAGLKAQAPATYKVKFDTSVGDVRRPGARATGRPTAPIASSTW